MNNDINNQITVCLVSPFTPPFGGMAVQAGKLVRLLTDSGYKVIMVRTNPPEDRVKYWCYRLPVTRSICNVTRFLRDLHVALRQCDTVYFLTAFFNYFFWVTWPALFLIRLHAKPVVLSARGGEGRKFLNRYGFLVGPSIRQSAAVTTPSTFLQKALRDTLKVEAVVVPNLADLDQFQYISRSTFRPRLLVTRNLEHIYGIDVVIEAFRSVANQYPEAVLGIVGDGSLKSEFKEKVIGCGLVDKVVFHGEVPHARMAEIYKEYDIFVNGSRIDNLPGAILEAFASGLPVVTTAAGGIPSMVTDGKTGFLVDVDDDRALADKVERLLEDMDLSQGIAERARQECLNYSSSSVEPVLSHVLRSSCDVSSNSNSQNIAQEHGGQR